jgi:hypothetical protein
MMIAFEGATDPGSWAKAFGSINPSVAVVIVSIVPWIAILLIWRGSAKLGIVGIGTTIKNDLDYVIRLVEHAIGKPPTRDRESVPKAPEEPPRKAA